MRIRKMLIDDYPTKMIYQEELPDYFLDSGYFIRLYPDNAFQIETIDSWVMNVVQYDHIYKLLSIDIKEEPW